jgi:hypothetical protein
MKQNGVFLNNTGLSKIGEKDLLLLKEIIDRQYFLDEIAQAHEYLEKGHKKECNNCCK